MLTNFVNQCLAFGIFLYITIHIYTVTRRPEKESTLYRLQFSLHTAQSLNKFRQTHTVHAHTFYFAQTIR